MRFSTRQVLYSDLTHAALGLNVQLLREKENYEDTVGTPRAITVAYGRFSEPVCHRASVVVQNHMHLRSQN